MLIPIEHNKPSIPAPRPNSFVLNGGDLWGMAILDRRQGFVPQILW
jgi:hypothetical protein